MSAEYPYHIRDIHISDPFILADPVSKRYYTYSGMADFKRFPNLEGGGARFFVFESEDLINWKEPAVCFEQGDFWADKDYWAPEVHIWKGKYYLISSFRAAGTYRRCQCLAADSPKGPFRQIKQAPVTPEGWQCLDGTLYADRKGAPWMVFCHEWLQVNDGQICAVPLSTDLGEAIGDPIILFRASDAPWRAKQIRVNGHGFVTDGPFLHRMKNGSLIMLWSNFCETGGYTTGYAISQSGDIQGPWIQQNDALYALDGAHSMLFNTFEGQLIMALHCPNVHARKRILLFEMEEDGDKLHIINEVTGNWYNGIGGIANRFAYEEKIIEAPRFSQKITKNCINNEKISKEKKAEPKKSENE